MTDSELTKVTKEELANIDGYDENVYSSDYKRLIRCTPCPEENKFLMCEYDFSGVTVICDNACSDKTCGWFYLDKEIDVKLPEGITHIGDFAFKGRDIDWLEIPHSLTYMGRDPFALSSVYRIKNKNEKFIVKNGCIINIQEGILVHNISSKGRITIPEIVVEIGEYSFSRLKKPKKQNSYDSDKKELELIIPSTVRKIGGHAFQRNNLKSITFIGVPEIIGDGIFEECTLLETIYVPKGTKAKYSELLPDYATIIDESGDSVNKIVFKNFLKSNGITDFYIIEYSWKHNVYGYVKDTKFHFSDEQGNELKRENIGIPSGVIVFDIVDETYKWLKEKSSCKGKGIAIDSCDQISWIGSNENFYVRISPSQIVIHKCELIDDFVERAHIRRDYNHRARLFGENSNLDLISIDEEWYYYNDNGKIRVIFDGKLHQDEFESIEVKSFKIISKWKHFIIVSKSGKWGFFTIEGKYVEPKYCMIDCLKDTYFYTVQKPDGCLGIAGIYGEEILGASNRFLDIYEVDCQNMNLIATTEDNIYIVCCDYSPLEKVQFNYRCSSIDINKSDIIKLEIGNAYRENNFGRESKTQFIYVVMKDGKKRVFDNYGWDITDSDEYHEWEEREWEVKDVLYDISPREKKKADETQLNQGQSTNDDELPF